MEIVPVQIFNLETAIDSTYRDWSAKQQLLAISQSEAEQKAIEVLLNQFQSQLNDVLQPDVQNALQIKIEVVSQTFEVKADFVYSGIQCHVVKQMLNDSIVWMFCYQGKCVTCFPDCLQKQIFIELGRIKNMNAN
jgi:hypothetical protein